jgi:hypothetical protein
LFYKGNINLIKQGGKMDKNSYDEIISKLSKKLAKEILKNEKQLDRYIWKIYQHWLSIFRLGFHEAMSSFDLSGNLSTLQHFSVSDIRLTPYLKFFENYSIQNSKVEDYDRDSFKTQRSAVYCSK